MDWLVLITLLVSLYSLYAAWTYAGNFDQYVHQFGHYCYKFWQAVGLFKHPK